MTVVNMTQARRELFQVLANAMTPAVLASISGAVIHYDGRDAPQKDPTKNYVESYVRPAVESQQTLANHEGKRRWGNRGTLFILCFGALSTGKGLENAETLATIAKLAYSGKSTDNCIWFRNARIQYLGSSGGWYQINVLVDYEYDEVR